jgi:hypothetical protein
MQKPFEPEIAIGHPIKVYRNFRTKLWSIMDANTRRVIGHAARVLVTDATFPVNAKGVHKIRETRRKRVVAFVAGKFHGYYETNAGRDTCQQSVEFNPYKNLTFVDSHGYTVKSADMVDLIGSGWVWANHLR